MVNLKEGSSHMVLVFPLLYQLDCHVYVRGCVHMIFIYIDTRVYDRNYLLFMIHCSPKSNVDDIGFLVWPERWL